MGTKKNGMTILRGSLQKHWMMYVTDLQMNVNPTDLNAVNLGCQMIADLSRIKSQYVQPGFIYKHTLMQAKTYH